MPQLEATERGVRVFVRARDNGKGVLQKDSAGVEIPWDYGLSEEGCTDRFWNAADLPAILHPSEGAPVLTTSHFKPSADRGWGRFLFGPL